MRVHTSAFACVFTLGISQPVRTLCANDSRGKGKCATYAIFLFRSDKAVASGPFFSFRLHAALHDRLDAVRVTCQETAVALGVMHYDPPLAHIEVGAE